MAISSFASFLDENSIRFERVLPTRIEVVWSYLTEPDLLATWLAQASFDPREGGKIQLVFDAEEASHCYAAGDSVTGTIDQFSPPQHLTYTWDFNTSRLDKVHQTHVAFEIEGCEESDSCCCGTALFLTHTRIPSEDRARFAAAWQTHLAILDARLRGEAPPVFAEIFHSVSEGYRSMGFDLAEEEY